MHSNCNRCKGTGKVEMPTNWQVLGQTHMDCPDCSKAHTLLKRPKLTIDSSKVFLKAGEVAEVDRFTGHLGHFKVEPPEPKYTGVPTTKGKIEAVFDNLKDLLLYKNSKYGDSALNPTKVFSKLSALDGLKIRLDDKVSRIINSPELRKNDVADVIGYLALICIAQDWLTFEEYKD